ncbi:hypothetical protein O3M35_010917 [Rhynocoris fuscipes]|uniref:CN hydrolase domain-containing protein n=1 Tax=Rhynocoris fuscipes TaxID=488301 RepID=A0AAW1D1R2_9HEMI
MAVDMAGGEKQLMALSEESPALTKIFSSRSRVHDQQIKMFQWTVCKLTILVSYLIINTSQESRPLIGSVVNYTPIWDQNKSNTDNILKNAENYCKLISDASKLSADIVVFPAEGLTGSTNSKISPIILPNIFDNPSDKNDSNQVLSLLSSCTKSRNIYSVFTINEQLNNHNCLTQIALNRNGTIIAR